LKDLCLVILVVWARQLQLQDAIQSTIEPVHKQELSGVFHMVGKDLTVLKGQKEAIERVLARSQKTERGQSKGKSLRSEPTGPPFDLNIVPTLVSFFTQIM
jgi:hypothetical protein